jgi:hypothetical protein
MNLLASAFTPSFYAPVRRRRRRKSPKAAVERLAALHGQGRDLWTGEPLKGKDLEDWLKMQAQADSDEAGIDDPAIRPCVHASVIPEAAEKGAGEKRPA